MNLHSRDSEGRVRYGDYRIYLKLRDDGGKMNRIRVHQLYQQEKLSLRKNSRRRHAKAAGKKNPGRSWVCMLPEGLRFRCVGRLRVFTDVNDYSWGRLATKAVEETRGAKVATVLGRIPMKRGTPKRLRVD